LSEGQGRNTMARSATLKLTTAIGRCPHVIALKDESVKVLGVEFEHVALKDVEIFRRMACDGIVKLTHLG
jgi:hypothetical protein